MHSPDATTAVPFPDFTPAAEPDDLSPFIYPEAASVPTTGRVGFTVFILATAALLIRPSDLFENLQNIPIYQTMMLACIAVSISRLLYHLTPRSPAFAITQLILGVTAMVVIGQLARGAFYEARTGGWEFCKVVLYYMLILCWVDSPTRLRRYLLCVCACILILTVLAVLDYDGLISLPAMRSLEQHEIDPATGAVFAIRRLCATGIISDPNDLCLVLVMAMILCMSFAGYAAWGRLRNGWLIPLGLFGYAVMLTSSRGGLLSLLGAGAAVLISRYGRGKGLFFAVILVPLLLLVFSGRQTDVDFSDPGNTFQARIDHWSESLTLFESAPFVGIGEEQQGARTGWVAHNSFIQSFAELGFVGGACFLGAFGFCIIGLHNTKMRETDRQLARLRPYILGIVAGYGIGLLALSRAYTAPTYLVLGIAAAYINLTPRLAPLRLDSRAIRRLAGGSVLFIFATYFIIREMST